MYALFVDKLVEWDQLKVRQYRIYVNISKFRFSEERIFSENLGFILEYVKESSLYVSKDLSYTWEFCFAFLFVFLMFIYRLHNLHLKF